MMKVKIVIVLMLTCSSVLVANAAHSISSPKQAQLPHSSDGRLRVGASTAKPSEFLISNNWSGIGLIDSKKSVTRLTYVGAQMTIDWWYTVPSFSCRPNESSEASIWVGAGGVVKNEPLYQTGIVLVCNVGTPSISAFREKVPGESEIDYPNTSTHPGDSIEEMVIETRTSSGWRFDVDLEDWGPSNQNDAPIYLSQWTYRASSEVHSFECVVERPTEVSGGKSSLYRFLHFDTIDLGACRLHYGGSDESDMTYLKYRGKYQGLSDTSFVLTNPSGSLMDYFDWTKFSPQHGQFDWFATWARAK